MMFERDAIQFHQARPVVSLGDDGWMIVGRLRALVRHFEEQQKSELLYVIAVRKTVIAQDVAVVPKFVDEGG